MSTLSVEHVLLYQIRNDLIRLNSCTADQVSTLTEMVHKYLSNTKKENGSIFQEELVIFAESNVKDIDNVSLKSIVRALVLISRKASKECWTVAQLTTAYESAGVNDTVVNLIISNWRKRHDKKYYQTINRVEVVNVTHVIDLEWSFGMSLASNELDEINVPFVQLNFLHLGDNQKATSMIEMTLDQFYSFLAQMEKAHTYVDLMQE